MEFKRVINDYHEVSFQVIKSLSRLRIKGIPLPANILLISLNTQTAYKYNSVNFLEHIEKIYIGASSVNNQGFSTSIKPEIIDYSGDIGKARLIEILRERKYTKININEDCIIGWTNTFYKLNPKGTKACMIGGKEKHEIFPHDGEIRKPSILKDYINPYTEKTNDKFKYLMDCINDRLSKKELGAFYTPTPYCKLAAELVAKAIAKVPEGNDYVIIDRCAGTGNLEEALTEEQLKHCILSTYEYYEYKVLVARLGHKANIIPVDEKDGDYKKGRLEYTNAMSEKYINNELLQSYIKNPKMTIILLENPPYSEIAGNNIKQEQKRDGRFFLKEEIKKDIKGSASNDISNLFIWSAFKYYLRQSSDSYIVFSPVKYFKSIGLANKKFNEGFLLNRKHFHASPSAISLIWWQNIDEKKESFTLKGYDIELKKENGLSIQEQTNQGNLKYEKDVDIKRVYKIFSDSYYDKRKFEDDVETNIWRGDNGYKQNDGVKIRVKSYFNNNIIAYMQTAGFSIDVKHLSLVRQTTFHGDGFYLRSDNFVEKLPLFCAKLYPQNNWYERDVYFTTADGGFEYTKDKEFLKSCFIFTCLSQRNKCISFLGTDGRFYKNELCFDEYTIASNHLKTLQLNEDDNSLIQTWSEILTETKQIISNQSFEFLTETPKQYKGEVKWGLYQIIQEVNTFYKDKKNVNIYNYPTLNTKINTLKEKLKTYYAKHIQDKLFRYELLK